MFTKGADSDNLSEAKILVTWDKRYFTGIELIDNQHRELVYLTNQLYQACLSGDKAAGDTFNDAMHRMVEYVRFHFGAEQGILERVRYPLLSTHKLLHDKLIKQILDTVKDYKEGKRFVPNQFVRTLKDWIFGHIAVHDRYYAVYIADQRRKGLIPDSVS